MRRLIVLCTSALRSASANGQAVNHCKTCWMSAKSNVNAMTDLKESSAKRIAKLVRLMSSEHDGEWSNAVRKLKLFLRNEGLTFNDLATVIENCDGAIEERRYSDMDAEIIFARGVEKGRKETERELPPEFYDGDGDPRWNEIALFCQKNNARLTRRMGARFHQ